MEKCCGERKMTPEERAKEITGYDHCIRPSVGFECGAVEGCYCEFCKVVIHIRSAEQEAREKAIRECAALEHEVDALVKKHDITNLYNVTHRYKSIILAFLLKGDK